MARAAVLGRLSWLVARLADISDETATARTLILEVPGWPGHLPGQHIDVRLTAEDGYSTQRSYSIASAPAGSRLELTIQRLDDGEVSPYLAGVLSRGDPLELRGPVGGYFAWHPADPAPVLLIGGGSGVVPLMAMVRTRIASGSQAPMRLIYSTRSRDTLLYAAELERIAAGAIKVSSRDLGPAVARRAVGATTVAATMRAAGMAGIRFFATGGIGGVHRGHPDDQSADLVELGRTPVAVFCAGAKIILDLALTLERLESLSVPVLGYGCDELPAFYTSHSGCPVGARVDGPEETAAVLRAAWATGARGVVVAVPPPGELDGAEDMVERAVRDLAGVTGPELTPRLLARVAELSGGRSLDLNVDLVVNNARVAARVASCLAS